jgi:DNA-binding CsgD family transcriptional regulator
MEQYMMASNVTVHPGGKLNPVPLTEGIILVDSNSLPVAMDSGAEAILHDLKKSCITSNRDHELPPQIVAFLGRNGHDSDGMQLSFKAGGHEYSCRAFLVKAENGSIAQILALHLKRELSLFDAVRHVADEYHLTDREQEALIGISRGLSSKEVAVQMKISPNTVKAFLRLIMIKMGTGSRAGLVAKLLDQNGLRVTAESPPGVRPSPRAAMARE